MSELMTSSANYCTNCGETVETVEAVRADEEFAAELTVASQLACIVVEANEVRIYHHEEDS